MYGTLNAKFEEGQTIRRAETWTRPSRSLSKPQLWCLGRAVLEQRGVCQSGCQECRLAERDLANHKRSNKDILPKEEQHGSLRTIRGRPTSIEWSGVSASTDSDARDAQGEAISTCQVAADVWMEKSSTQSCAGGKADTSTSTILCALHTTRVKSSSGAKSAQAIRDLSLVQSF